MNRSSAAVLVCVVLLVGTFGAYVLSLRSISVAPFGQDLGLGLAVVGSFFVTHLVLTVVLGIASFLALRAWRRDPRQRTQINRLVLACGWVAVTLAISYAAFFLWG